MARLLSRTLIRTVDSYSQSQSTVSSVGARIQILAPNLVLTHNNHQQRSRSTQTGKIQLIEVELDSADDVEVEVPGVIRKLEEVIQDIIVRRSAPDWLPFIPGSSYWVPPRLVKKAPCDIVQLIGKMASTTNGSGVSGQLDGDEAMAVASNRGWPSSAFFIERSAPMHPVPVEIEVKIHDNLNNPPKSETDDE